MLLWGIVAIRLISPLSIESVISLIPSAETISPEIMMDRTPEINTGIPILNNTLNPVISQSFTPDLIASANPLQILIPILSAVWLIGIAGMIFYTVISYFKIKRKIGTAVLYRDNIFQSENVASPFVLGVIKPKIYLPFNMSAQDIEHVIAHENAHIRRKDHLWKPLGFLLLALHWFNPLMWLGYVFLCRDIEFACDEKVIKDLNTDQKSDYLEALLICSVNRKIISACPLAFGEVGVKSRVKSVLSYKKPAFWIIITAVIASVAVAVCFLTNPPKEAKDGEQNEDDISSAAPDSDIEESPKNEDETIWTYNPSLSYSGHHLRAIIFDYDNYTNATASCTSGLIVNSAGFGAKKMKFENGQTIYWSPGDMSIDNIPHISEVQLYYDGNNSYHVCTLIFECVSRNDATAEFKIYLKGIDEYFSLEYTDIGVKITPNVKYSSLIIDVARFDIDGDGKDEACTLRHGPTSGLFTFTFSAYEDGELEYFNVFNSPWMKMHFERSISGEMMLVGEGYKKDYHIGLEVRDGNIVLLTDDDDNGGFWYYGEQGVDSPLAPKNK